MEARGALRGGKRGSVRGHGGGRGEGVKGLVLGRDHWADIMFDQPGLYCAPVFINCLG